MVMMYPRAKWCACVVDVSFDPVPPVASSLVVQVLVHGDHHAHQGPHLIRGSFAGVGQIDGSGLFPQFLYTSVELRIVGRYLFGAVFLEAVNSETFKWDRI